jgi:hypothetical protein
MGAMSTSLLLFLGDLGGSEVMLISLIPALLIIAVLWRIFRPSKPTVIVQQSSTAHSVADELNKLQMLREQGVLTEEEFRAQKERLLRG